MLHDGGRPRTPLWARVLVVVLLVAPVGLALDSLSEKSWTWDEPIYLAGGHYLAYTGHLRTQALSYHPPLVMYWNSLGLLPLGLDRDIFTHDAPTLSGQLGMRVAFASDHAPERVRFFARLPFVLLIPLLGAIVYLWARDLWGWQGGLLALWLTAWNPNLLAHARFVANDYLFTLLFVGTLWSVRGLLRHGGTARVVRTGLFTGLAFLAKFTAVILGPVGVLCAWWAVRMSPGSPWRTWSLPRVCAAALGVAALAFAVLWLGYLGEVAVALPNLDERAAAASAGPPAGGVGRLMYALYTRDIPLPAMTYLMGFFSQYAHGAGGHSNYLLGEVSGAGWWYYFPAAVLMKTPLAELGLWIVGCAAWWRSGGHRRELALILIGPVVLMVLSSGANINIGLRHVLILYPLGAIAAAAAAYRWRSSNMGRACLVLGALACAIPAWRVHPHYLTYFNTVAGGPAGGHRALVDSNLDWGQDIAALFARAQAEHWLPMQIEYFGPPGRLHVAPPGFTPLEDPCQPATGFIAISVTKRMGVYMNDGAACFAWLDAYEPIARIHNTIWVYDIPEDVLDGPA